MKLLLKAFQWYLFDANMWLTDSIDSLLTGTSCGKAFFQLIHSCLHLKQSSSSLLFRNKVWTHHIKFPLLSLGDKLVYHFPIPGRSVREEPIAELWCDCYSRKTWRLKANLNWLAVYLFSIVIRPWYVKSYISALGMNSSGFFMAYEKEN